MERTSIPPPAQADARVLNAVNRLCNAVYDMADACSRRSRFRAHPDFAGDLAGSLALSLWRAPSKPLLRWAAKTGQDDDCAALLRMSLRHEFTRVRRFRDDGRTVSLDALLESKDAREERGR